MAKQKYTFQNQTIYKHVHRNFSNITSTTQAYEKRVYSDQYAEDSCFF